MLQISKANIDGERGMMELYRSLRMMEIEELRPAINWLKSELERIKIDLVMENDKDNILRKQGAAQTVASLFSHIMEARKHT